MHLINSVLKRRGFLVLFLGLSSFSVNAQVVKPLFYTKYWELTVKDSAEYFRVGILDTTNYTWIGSIKDYQLGGKLVMEGAYQQGKKNGVFYFYYLDGTLEKTGEFKNDIQKGIWKSYYPNAKLKSEVEFTDAGFTPISFYDTLGNRLLIDGTGYWEELFYEFGIEKPLKNVGHFKNHKRDGKWFCTLGDVTIYEEIYNNNKLISIKKIEGEKLKKMTPPIEFKNKMLPDYKFQVMEEFVTLHYINRDHYPFLSFLPKPLSEGEFADVIFTVVEQTATPKGGMQAFYNYVGKNLKMPSKAKGKIEGKVFVQFNINSDGSISDVICIKGIGFGCDEEAVRVVRESPAWIPGHQRGKPVKQRMVLPITFKTG